MNTYISDEKREISYILQGDYCLPDLKLPEKGDHPIGTWGQRHLRYLKQHRKVLYYNLLTSGRLNSYLADVDVQAEEMFSQLVSLMAENESINERMKAENPMEWVHRMNAIRNSVIEIMKCFYAEYHDVNVNEKVSQALMNI